ncbi:MAG: M28 family peptidase [Planctomycetota bacterium]
MLALNRFRPSGSCVASSREHLRFGGGRRMLATMMWVFGYFAIGVTLSATVHGDDTKNVVDDTVAADDTVDPDSETVDPENERQFLRNTRQITFGGKSGEGYFSADARRMVFQSESEPDNPFYQIYLMEFETGDLQRISSGTGKTTCAWIHPDGTRVMYAGTEDDPQRLQKQKDRIELLSSGKKPRYSWDYDSTYEIYEYDLESGHRRRLTHAEGYDAEGAYSPDGSEIVFTSNRSGYDESLPPALKERLKVDKQYFCDIFIMNADGTNVRQLTDVEGYDGGPFFSADGKKICWRRFSENGLAAEIYTMNRDGSDVRRLTSLNKVSWAPYFHPSGEYLIFTTNVHGFSNFELYLERADGTAAPVRVTHNENFDGLPVFLPDGNRLAWTSNRTANGQSQIHLADWDHAAARRALQLDAPEPVKSGLALSTGIDSSADSFNEVDLAIAKKNLAGTVSDYSPRDLLRHVDYLTRKELGGRLTGTAGEKRATAYVAAFLDSLGFVPAGENGTFFDSFEFPAGSELQDGNSLTVGDQSFELGKDFTPLSFSGDGDFESDEVIFAGYGLQVPGSQAGPDGKPELPPYDSYIHLNVTDRYVMVFRDLPQDITPEMRQRMARYASPRRKAAIARDLGAKGILFVSGPTSKVRNKLIRFDRSATSAGISMAAVSISDEVAQKLLGDDVSLKEVQSSLDNGELAMGTMHETESIRVSVAIDRRRGTGRNVIARLPADPDANKDTPVRWPFVMLGAHIDHLGRGGAGNSLATEDEIDQIHVGADDNASGVAAMLEIAQNLANLRRKGQLSMKRDLVVAAWSGEELGLFGSQAYVKQFAQLYPDAPLTPLDTETARIAAAHGVDVQAAPLGEAIAAYLNLDMVGRMDESLIIQGIGSSPDFEAMVPRRNVPVGLPLTLDKTSTGLPTDASAFVARDVPILSFFTGAHEDYHTPRDTAEKLNYESMADISRLGGLIVRGWLVDREPPVFELNEGAEDDKETPRVNLRASLGTIPDYVGGKVPGQKLSGVRKNGPADKAGVQGGDIVVELAGRTVEDINDYTYAIEALKIGEEVEMKVYRGGKTITLKITPESRD